MKARLVGLFGALVVGVVAHGQGLGGGLAEGDTTGLPEEPGAVETNAWAGSWGVGLGSTQATVSDPTGEDADSEGAELLGPALSTRLYQVLEAPDEMRVGRTAYRGPLVVFFKRQNPLAVFDPFRPAMPSEKADRPLWDPYLGGPRGIVLFSIHR